MGTSRGSDTLPCEGETSVCIVSQGGRRVKRCPLFRLLSCAGVCWFVLASAGLCWRLLDSCCLVLPGAGRLLSCAGLLLSCASVCWTPAVLCCLVLVVCCLVLDSCSLVLASAGAARFFNAHGFQRLHPRFLDLGFLEHDVYGVHEASTMKP